MAKTENEISELRKKSLENKLIRGLKDVKRKLTEKKISKVIIAKNCPQETKEELQKICALTGTELQETELNNEELGVVCKKQYSVTVLGVLK